ncbi:MAG TPA: GNAT family N-acetyltransferase [Humisphaera sp.]
MGEAPAIRELTTDAEEREAFYLMNVLRPKVDRSTFAERLAAQRAEGYRLAGGYIDGRLVVLAGFRESCTMARGPHLFVDDLVTDPSLKGKGHGKAMIAWLKARAAERGLPQVWLDSRDTAVGFYEGVGFTFSTSKPCWANSAE